MQPAALDEQTDVHSVVHPTATGAAWPFHLPGYEVRGVLGSGGFGVVYRAERSKDRFGVAIKVASCDQRGAAERLVMEAEALVAIGPPFAPVVYGSGEQNGQVYVVLELIQAATLDERLVQEAGPMPLGRFTTYARAILDAVEAVHVRGYVHCDLKPENIFLDEPGAKLIDFGSARHVSKSAAGQRDDAALGTAEYMSPEQCEARKDIDFRADVYALGILMYELLSGSPPFWGNGAEVREAQASRRPPRLGSKVAVGPELDEVVMHCLAKEPADRFASVSQVRTALLRALSNARTTPPAATQQGGFAVVQSTTRATPLLSRGFQMPTAKPAPPRVSREKRPVGLLFFESTGGVVQITQALSALNGQLAQASGSQYVGVFGHDVADNPARSALLAAQRMLEKKLTARVLVDVAPVSIQIRPDGERRFLSMLFARKERYPQISDPVGILITESAAEVLADVPTRPVAGRNGIACVDLSERPVEVTTFGTHGEALLGRDELLETITHCATQAAHSGIPAMVTLVGEPGYGKSLIASTFVQRILHLVPRAHVFKLTGQESLGGAIHPTLRDLLRQVLSAPENPPADFGEALLSERIGPSLGPQVWPAAALVLGWVPPEHPQVRHLSAAPGALRSAASRAAGEILRGHARERPTMIVLDDAHLADEAALDALEYATLPESDASICVCAVTLPALERARPTWGNRAGVSQRISVGPLDKNAASLVARRLLEPVEHVPEAALDKLVERTQGIPRLLVELVRGLRRAGLVRRLERGSGYYLATDELDRLPDLPVVQWSATREIEALPPQLAGHARLAAAFRGKFTVSELDGVLRILEREGAFTETQMDAGIGVRRLLDAGLLNRGPHGQLDFRHALLRDTLYESLPEELRKAIHHAAFELYRGSTSMSEEERLPRLALHAARSGQRREAASTYLVLAERAQHRHAYLDAELLYSGALENLPDTETPRITDAAQGRGLMRFRLGRFGDSMKDLTNAREYAQQWKAIEKELELLLDEAMVSDWMSDYASAAELARAAAERVNASSSELLQARLLLALGRSDFRAGQYEHCVSRTREAAQRAERLDDAGYETLVIAWLLAGVTCAILSRLDEAEEFLDKAIVVTEQRGDLLHLAAALNNRIFVWNGRRDAVRFVRDLSRVREVARQTGFGPLEFNAEINLAEIYYWLGQVTTARGHTDRALKLSRQLWGDTAHGLRVELLSARQLLYTEDLAAARRTLDDIRARERQARESGQADAQLVPSDQLLADMIELATRDNVDEADWQSLRQRCEALSAAQELIEVIEFQGLQAKRFGRRDVARRVLGEALQIAATSPGLLMDRLSRELAEIEHHAPSA